MFGDGLIHPPIAALRVLEREDRHVGNGRLHNASAVHDLDQTVASGVGDAEREASDMGVHVNDFKYGDWKALAAEFK